MFKKPEHRPKQLAEAGLALEKFKEEIIEKIKQGKKLSEEEKNSY